MGAIAEAMVAYIQPLLDQTDGSLEQINKAMTIGQLCYNLALFPEEERAKTLDEMRSSFGMNDADLEEFKRDILLPMIRRHEEMFPGLHQRVSRPLGQSNLQPKMAEPAKAYPGTDRYAPCPCGSGEKYKFCCGKKGR